MFRRRKKDKSKSPKKGTIDKIIMGAVVGTAIGSVIGLSVAPKEGKETRKMIKEKYDDRGKIIKKGKDRLIEYEDDIKEINQLAKETMAGFMTLTKNFLFGKKKDKGDTKSHGLRDHNSLKQIPNEMEIEELADYPED